MNARRHFHSVVFVAAGLYNIIWGLYAVIDPQWLFRFAGMPQENYPQVFACLGIAPETEIRDRLNRPHPISRGQVLEQLF